MIIDVVLVFLMLTLNIFQTFSGVSIVDFEQLNVSWGIAALVVCKLSKTITNPHRSEILTSKQVSKNGTLITPRTIQ